MSGFDKNKIFFGLVHYILSEQKNVDWILKTSLIDITGISSVLEQKPYNRETLLNEVIDYVSEMKPYHTQFSKYFEHYETASETIKIPKNDVMKTLINQKFDAIKTTPDIEKIIYSREYKKMNPSGGYDLPSGPEYNKEGLEIIDYESSKLYTRTTDEYGNWYWEESYDILLDGIYYETKNDKYFIVKNNALSDEEFDKDSFINAHMANRLFYLGFHDYDELKKELNANFKGIEINGNDFYLGEFGYDVFDYSTNDYDSPTIIYDYCFLNSSENFDKFKNKPMSYTKIFEESGTHYFSLPKFSQYTGKYFKVYRQKDNDDLEEIINYTPPNFTQLNYIDIYDGLSKNEKMIIAVYDNEDKDSNLLYAYVVTGYPFSPSSSEILKREIVDLNTTNIIELTPPSKDLDTNKLAIQKQDVNGGSKPFFNYQMLDSKLIINPTDIKEEEHIIITSFDYKYLYDKIYTWEDSYGRSNNITRISGDKFLRARNESDRPRELTVSHPQNSLMIYSESDTSLNVFYNDYKNDLYEINYEKSQQLKVDNIEYNGNMLKSIILSSLLGLEKNHGYILINSEIIEYNEMDKSTNKLSSLRRGIDGTVLNISEHEQLINVGDIVYPYIKDTVIHKDRNNLYVSYNIKNPNILQYSCPFGVKENSEIEVRLLKKINLLQNVTAKSTEIIIDSCNVVDDIIQDKLKYETTERKYVGDFYLKINEDVIPFKTIYKEHNSESRYHIKDFILPSIYDDYGDDVIYSSENTFIHCCCPELFTDYSVSFISSDIECDVSTVDNEINVLLPDGSTLYRIVGNIVYDKFNTEVGIYQNSTICRDDGTIMAKIIDDTFYTIEPVIVLNNRLNIGESIHIKANN